MSEKRAPHGTEHRATDVRLDWICDHDELGARIEVDAGDVVEVGYSAGSDNTVTHLDEGVILHRPRGGRVLSTVPSRDARDGNGAQHREGPNAATIQHATK